MCLVTELDARPVDPRDQRWEVWDPRYRVYFWRQVGDGHHSREFEVAAKEVQDVLAWADERRSAGETFTVFAVVDHGDRGLVRLAGTDPTRDA
jgi:hypothetical protein